MPPDMKSFIVGVKKHWEKQMAFVTFSSPDCAAAVIAMQPTSLCNIAIMPPIPHNTDPSTIVVKWREGVDLQERDIAAEFEGFIQSYASTVLGGGPADAPLAGTFALGDQHPAQGLANGAAEPRQPVVIGVKKHWQKQLAYVSFASPQYATAAMSASPSMINHVKVLSPRPHATDPCSIMIKWEDGSELGEDQIAAAFENLFTQASPSALVCVKKHWEKQMAYVTFAAPEIAQVFLQDPTRDFEIGHSKVNMTSHKADPSSIVVYWTGDPNLPEASICEHFERQLSERFGMTASALAPSVGVGYQGACQQVSSPVISPMIRQVSHQGSSQVSGQSFVTEVQTQRMAVVAFQTSEMAQLIMQDMARGAQFGTVVIDPVLPNEKDDKSIIMYWKEGDLSDAMIAQYFENHLATLLSNMPKTGQGQFVANVKKHATKRLAYVRFQSQDIAQYALQDPVPRQTIGAVRIDPPVQHRGDPQTIVVFWHESDLDEEMIGNHFEQRMATLLSQGQVEQAPPNPANTVSTALRPEIWKHATQPMAFVIFTSQEAAQLLMQNPPDSICGLPALPVIPHRNNQNAAVLKWRDGGAVLSEDLIASDIQQHMTMLYGALSSDAASWQQPDAGSRQRSRSPYRAAGHARGALGA